MFGKVNLVKHDVLVLSSLLLCDMNTKEVLGIAGVGNVVVLRDVLLKLVGESLTSKEEDIVDVDGDN